MFRITMIYQRLAKVFLICSDTIYVAPGEARDDKRDDKIDGKITGAIVLAAHIADSSLSPQ